MSSSPCSALVSRQRVCWTGLPVGRVCLISLLSYHNSSPRGTTNPTARACDLGIELQVRAAWEGLGPYVLARSRHDTGHTRRRNRYILEGSLGGGVLGGRCGVLQVYWMRMYMILEGAAWRFLAERVGSDCTASLTVANKSRQNRPWCPDRQDCVIWSR